MTTKTCTAFALASILALGACTTADGRFDAGSTALLGVGVLAAGALAATSVGHDRNREPSSQDYRRANENRQWREQEQRRQWRERQERNI